MSATVVGLLLIPESYAALATSVAERLQQVGALQQLLDEITVASGAGIVCRPIDLPAFIGKMKIELTALRAALQQRLAERDAEWSKMLGFAGPPLDPELAAKSIALVN